MARPSRAVIDLEALKSNYRLTGELAPSSGNIAVIKANAYGHGAVPVARALEPLAPALAVAYMEEALELRQSGIVAPILILEGFLDREEVAVAADNGFWLLVENARQVETLQRTPLNRPLTVWLKVDTGMHRLGCPIAQASHFYRALENCPGITSPVVLATHLASADELNNDETSRQIERLDAIARPLAAPLSIANSPGLLAWPAARREWNRPGYMLFGNSPFPHPHNSGDRLLPVMTFESRVISLRTVSPGDGVGYGGDWRARRQSLIATVPVGYADGYPRTAPSGTPVLVNGQRAPLAGRVSMDLITVDVTDVAGVTAGSPVELWGKQLGIDDVAAPAATIGYELLARMPARVPRIYEG